MKVLVLGAGAREHALSWCLNQNSAEVYCAPGNGGTLSLAKNSSLFISPWGKLEIVVLKKE